MLKNKYIQNFLQNTIINLENFIKQLNKSGVNSELSIYICRINCEDYVYKPENILLGENTQIVQTIDEAFDFSQKWYRYLYLMWLNYDVPKEYRFRFKNILKLSGGNFGPNRTDISVNESENKDISLSKLDNITMNQM